MREWVGVFHKVQRIIARPEVFMEVSESLYNEDGLVSIHNHDFLNESAFKKAYKRGVEANESDLNWRWRVKVGLWAAKHAVMLSGDFVECGVNKGFLSSAIMEYLDWNKQKKRFYLFDTFSGLDESLVSKEERRSGRVEQARVMYRECYQEVLKNFKEFKRVKIVRGSVPTSLKAVNIERVSFLSLDMNNAKPELGAIRFFWPKLVRGAVVLLDDYAYTGYEPQKKSMDKFVRDKQIEVLPLPTGQGLLLKV
ncbi:hypothetical protein A3A66_00740 [Microgenomates group bacterium RIFCSPLOWO2_01_FULL_46_13]|nr:MAG: hypothetical protein A2783_02815 [Microgenomates group bacterium RIFCSPHIGHO2_01_FULL_45_11]OGV94907.1 MAG: hypothetical protein A3A66_00740 [Microgenomates group bacterium RIFCSPLOWO2_01_FULL_46_13]